MAFEESIYRKRIQSSSCSLVTDSIQFRGPKQLIPIQSLPLMPSLHYELIYSQNGTPSRKYLRQTIRISRWRYSKYAEDALTPQAIPRIMEVSPAPNQCSWVMTEHMSQPLCAVPQLTLSKCLQALYQMIPACRFLLGQMGSLVISDTNCGFNEKSKALIWTNQDFSFEYSTSAAALKREEDVSKQLLALLLQRTQVLSTRIMDGFVSCGYKFMALQRYVAMMLSPSPSKSLLNSAQSHTKPSLQHWVSETRIGITSTNRDSIVSRFSSGSCLTATEQRMAPRSYIKLSEQPVENQSSLGDVYSPLGVKGSLGEFYSPSSVKRSLGDVYSPTSIKRPSFTSIGPSNEGLDRQAPYSAEPMRRLFADHQLHTESQIRAPLPPFDLSKIHKNNSPSLLYSDRKNYSEKPDYFQNWRNNTELFSTYASTEKGSKQGLHTHSTNLNNLTIQAEKSPQGSETGKETHQLNSSTARPSSNDCKDSNTQPTEADYGLAKLPNYFQKPNRANKPTQLSFLNTHYNQDGQIVNLRTTYSCPVSIQPQNRSLSGRQEVRPVQSIMDEIESPFIGRNDSNSWRTQIPIKQVKKSTYMTKVTDKVEPKSSETGAQLLKIFLMSDNDLTHSYHLGSDSYNSNNSSPVKLQLLGTMGRQIARSIIPDEASKAEFREARKMTLFAFDP